MTWFAPMKSWRLTVSNTTITRKTNITKENHITIFDSKYIFKWVCFHCHVAFTEDIFFSPLNPANYTQFHSHQFHYSWWFISDLLAEKNPWPQNTWPCLVKKNIIRMGKKENDLPTSSSFNLNHLVPRHKKKKSEWNFKMANGFAEVMFFLFPYQNTI